MSSLGFSSGSAAFGVHRDVLEAKPSTESEILSLLEELKRRGRAAVASKAYPDAKALYSKAIDICVSDKDKAILYSNRSLCEFQMNCSEKARDDAEMATVLDPTYVKGFWRLGSAHAVRKNETAQALKAYQNALALEPKNVALQKEVRKLEQRLQKELAEQQKDKEAESNETTAAKKEPAAPPKKVTQKVLSSKSSSTSSSSSNEEKKNSDRDDDEEKVFSASDHVRGYKIVGGKKTSYFHHEQSEEEKRLIGDIAPKRIETPVAAVNPTTNDNNKSTSAWNTAGTWEERDVTSWAITTLTDALLKCHYDLPTEIVSNGIVKITKVTKLSEGGHASYATVRGKKRYIYEFCIGLNWELSMGDDANHKASGTMAFPDVDGTCELGDGYDLVEFHVDRDKSTSSTQPLVEKFVQHGGLRNVIHDCIDDWVRLFRSTY